MAPAPAARRGSAVEAEVRACVLLTGATGRLGKLLLPDLIQRCIGGADLYAAWHRRAPENAVLGRVPQWLRFDLARSDAVVNLLPAGRPLVVLHFACSMSNVMRTVLRTDCFGTDCFITALKNRIATPVWFVHASSIDAERNDLNYGLGKSYVENCLFAASGLRFTVCVVRMPAIEGPGFDRWHVDARDFARLFLQRIGFENALAVIENGGAVQATSEPIYLLNETAGRWKLEPGKGRRENEGRRI
jgi:nucleoside-diphosphate-sugar epimerase